MNGVTDDLASYLLARLDEDEQVARQAEAVIPDGEGWYRVTQLTVADPEWAQRYGHAYAHIARWDPARVLAEVEAKRRIVEQHEHAIRSSREYPNAVNIASWMAWQEAVRALAQPYADRSDFRDSWRS